MPVGNLREVAAVWWECVNRVSDLHHFHHLYVTARYSCPVVRTAHAIRVILLASATTATFECFFSPSLSIQGPKLCWLLLSRANAARAPSTKSFRRYWFPRLLIPSSFGLPPEEC